MKSHVIAKPGEYAWDPEEKRFVGKLKNNSLEEDRRFTAEASYSFMNGVCKGLTISDPSSVQKALTDPEFNGYVVQGFSIIIDGIILEPEMWMSDAAKLTGCKGIDNILGALGPLSLHERQAKLEALANIFGKELDVRGLGDDPEVKAAKRRQQRHQDREKLADQRRVQTWNEARNKATKALIREYNRLRGTTWNCLPEWALPHGNETSDFHAITDNPKEWLVKQADEYSWDPSPFVDYWGNCRPPYYSRWGELYSHELEGLDFYFEHYELKEEIEEIALQMAAEYAINRYRTKHKQDDFKTMRPEALLSYLKPEIFKWGIEHWPTALKWYKSTKRVKAFKRLRKDVPEQAWEFIEEAVEKFWKAAVGNYPICDSGFFPSTQSFLDILHMETPSSPLRNQTKYSLPSVVIAEIDCAARGASATL